MACDGVPARYVLCLMLFLGFMVTFLLRANLTIAIVAMVKEPVRAEEPGGGAAMCGTQPRPAVTSSNETVTRLEPQGEFEWGELQQSVILSAFFWGYVVFQVPGGRVAELHGTKRVYGAALGANGIISLLLPWAAKGHWTLLLLMRALQGLAQGVVFPAMSAIVVRWVPVSERARFVSFAFQGASLGTVVALPLCGWVLQSWGWEAVFHVSGVLSLVWTAAWWLLVFDSPDQHPRITAKEREFLSEHLEPVKAEPPPVPWLAALRSRQFWLGNLAGIGNDWGFHTFFNLGPKYMKTALGFDLKSSSWLSSLPFLSQYVFAMVYGSLADLLLQRGVRLVTVRKVSVVVSHLLPVVGLLVLAYSGCNAVLSVVVLTLSVTMIGAVTSGFFQTPMDIAPNFAGVLTGVMNGLGSITPVLSTPLAGAVLQSFQEAPQVGWRYVFWVSAAMYVLGAVPFLLFYRAQVEPWNDEDKTGKRPADLQLKDLKAQEA